MDLESLKYLSDEDKNRYMTLERMFQSDGWKVLMAWAVENHEQQMIRAVMAPSWEDHRIATGARLALEQVIRFEQTTEAEYQQRAEDAMLSAESDDEVEYE